MSVVDTLSDIKRRVESELASLDGSAALENLRTLVAMGFETDICFCLGTGKNSQHLHRLNGEHGFFGKIVTLEHPRYIMQYKLRSKQLYIDKYLEAFGKTGHRA